MSCCTGPVEYRMPRVAAPPTTRLPSVTPAMTPLSSAFGELGALCGGEIDEPGVLLWLTVRRIEAGLASRRRGAGASSASMHPACVHEERELSYVLGLDFQELAAGGDLARDLGCLAYPWGCEDAPAPEELAAACRRIAEWCEDTG